MRWRSGSMAAVVLFLILAVFWTPKQYRKVDGKDASWHETFVSPIWKSYEGKFAVYQVPGGAVIIPRQETADFRSQTLARGVEPRRLPYRVPVTERGYVFCGIDTSLLALYVLLALAVGLLAAVGRWPSAMWRGVGAFFVSLGAGARAMMMAQRRPPSRPAPTNRTPSSDATPQAPDTGR